MRGEEERGRESCRRKKGGRRGESKEQRKRKKKEEETVREGERERRSLCLLCYPMKSGSPPWSPVSLTALQRPL